ncbi:MAG TPA: GNAT family N-acetyltransferase [Acidimicrobiales bacterium]
MTTREVRPVTEEEWPAFVRTDQTAFGSLPSEEDVAADRRPFDIDRSVAVFEDGRVVGAAAAFDFDLTLPGLTTSAAAGVTWVGVLPTHRRKGVLSALMRHQLDDVRERGEPLAILLASESVIYGRFGYGLATMQAEYELPRQYRALARPHEPAGRVVLVDEDEARKVLPDVHERVRRLQPGDVSRPDGWWNQFFRNSKRSGTAGARFYVVYEGASGEVEGYAYYRVGTGGQSIGSTEWTAMVQGLGATTHDAYLSLWMYVTDIDLTYKTTTLSRPIDEPLRYLLADPRRLRATNVSDFLWCRIVDLPSAMSARRYSTADRFVLDVADPFCPWNEGRWVVEGNADGASCTAASSTDDPDLVLGANDLGAVYLGGTRLASLVRAGRVEERTPGAAHRGDLFFQGSTQPYCQTFF